MGDHAAPVFAQEQPQEPPQQSTVQVLGAEPDAPSGASGATSQAARKTWHGLTQTQVNLALLVTLLVLAGIGVGVAYGVGGFDDIADVTSSGRSPEAGVGGSSADEPTTPPVNSPAPVRPVPEPTGPTCNMLSIYNLGLGAGAAAVLADASFGFSGPGGVETGCCQERSCSFAMLSEVSCSEDGMVEEYYQLTCCEDALCSVMSAQDPVTIQKLPTSPALEDGSFYNQRGTNPIADIPASCTPVVNAGVVTACTGEVDLIEATPVPTVAPVLNKGALVWEDEFDGVALDPALWGYAENVFPDGEQQFYEEAACQVFDGMLHLMAEPSPDPGATGGLPYTSCRIVTMPASAVLRGRIEIMAQLPKGVGTLPSFLMFPIAYEYGPWPQSGAIAILESLYDAQDLVSTIHYGDVFTPGDATSPKGQNGCNIFPGVDYTLDFHEFALEWTPGSISWFIDGTRYCMVENWFTTAVDPAENKEAPFDSPFDIVLGLGVGGDRVADVDPASLPWDMQIEYVRVYELTEEQAAYEGSLFPGPITEPTVPVKDGEAYSYLNDVDGDPLPWPLPARLPASMFDYGGQGVSFFDNTPQMNTGDSAIRRNYGVDIFENDQTLFAPKFTDTFGSYVLMEPGEWLSWTINSDVEAKYKIQFRYASVEQLHFKVLLDSVDCENPLTVVLDEVAAATGAFDEPANLYFDVIPLLPTIPAGVHTITYCALDNDQVFEFMFLGHDILLGAAELPAGAPAEPEPEPFEPFEPEPEPEVFEPEAEPFEPETGEGEPEEPVP